MSMSWMIRKAGRVYQKCVFVFEGRERSYIRKWREWYDDVMVGLIDREFKG
jgi:RimJ/RimL family protein N-acetyltransferase